MKKLLTFLFKGFPPAFQGLKDTAKNEKHFKFHIASTFTIIIISWILNIEKQEWYWILLCCSLVLAAELGNTAIEAAIDLISPEKHALAKKAKDAAAAMVLVLAIFSLMLAILVFWPYFVK